MVAQATLASVPHGRVVISTLVGNTLLDAETGEIQEHKLENSSGEAERIADNCRNIAVTLIDRRTIMSAIALIDTYPQPHAHFGVKFSREEHAENPVISRRTTCLCYARLLASLNSTGRKFRLQEYKQSDIRNGRSASSLLANPPSTALSKKESATMTGAPRAVPRP
jgi:hypothetical protein